MAAESEESLAKKDRTKKKNPKKDGQGFQRETEGKKGFRTTENRM